MDQIIQLPTPKVFAASIVGLFLFTFLLLQPSVGLLHLHQHLFDPHVESSCEQLQIQHLGLTPDLEMF